VTKKQNKKKQWFMWKMSNRS